MAGYRYRDRGGLIALLAVWACALAGCGGELGAVGGTDSGPLPFQSRAILRGEQETPPVTTDAFGTSLVTISGDRSSITVVSQTQGLVNPTAAHIHVAPPGVPGPIIFPLYDAATDGPLPATLTRTVTAANLQPRPAQGINTFADALAAIESGATYVNFHTQQNPAGEIRGQVGPVLLRATLTGAQEVPPVVTAATGSATIQLDAMQTSAAVTLTAQDITNVQLAHIHVGAPGVAGPVILPLFSAAEQGAFPGTVSRVVTAGDLQPQPAQNITTFDDAVSAMLAGRTYVNVHTQQNPNGEIRGQVGP